MSLFLNNKLLKKTPSSYLVLGVAVAVTSLSGIVALVATSEGRQLVLSDSTSNTSSSAYTGNNNVGSQQPVQGETFVNSYDPSLPDSIDFTHRGITTTVFWVGEAATNDNGQIGNSESAWDEHWFANFGGTDNPNNRNGILPAGFTPKENPFYFALPYSDIDDSGNRKSSATKCPLFQERKNSPHSWCKNSWIAIKNGEKIAYAQWEDAGPFGENDEAYVFGTTAPANKNGVGAGLDISPAVKDFLGLDDVSRCDWAFVSSKDVPSGPWKQIVTTTPGTTVN